MTKFLFAILLILSIYIYATVTSTSRADINHNVALVPHHIGQIWESAANKITDVQNDYLQEQGDK